MSNLFSYFQRIEPKKMATTTADDESIRPSSNTPKNGHTKKSQTPKESSRKSMNMSDVYSADSPKSEKRKPIDDHETLPKNKKRKTLNARNESDEDDDEPQLKVSKSQNRKRIAILDSDDDNGLENDNMDVEVTPSNKRSTAKNIKKKGNTSTTTSRKKKTEDSEDEEALYNDGSADESEENESGVEEYDDDNDEEQTKTPKRRTTTLNREKKKPPKHVHDNNFTHLSLDFLKDGKRRDINLRLHTDPNYDPRTLHVPEEYLNSITPAMRQWWVLKSEHYDTILFFKVGKFYELYHMDAVICVPELNLTMMKNESAHCGFPEKAYSKFADILVSKGYKVARVEQTETPDMMKQRIEQQTGRKSKFDKTVRREVCQITTPGTKTFNTLDNDNIFRESLFLLCIVEIPITDNKITPCEFGVCFVDTTIAQFYIGQFEDDRYLSRLQTLLAQYPPVQILCEKNKISEKTKKVLTLTHAKMEYLTPNKEMYETTKTLDILRDDTYFKDEKGNLQWPDAFQHVFNDGDAQGLHVRPAFLISMRALGGIIWYLQHCLIDKELLSMRKFSIFQPPDENVELKEASTFTQQNMVLDATTLYNLEILTNSRGGKEGSLLYVCDRCSTHFGKRLLARWLSAPLCNVNEINERLNAIDILREKKELCIKIRDKLKTIPDLERLFCRIHSLGHRPLDPDHPENRAILYEDITYSKRKIQDFLSAFAGLKVANDIVELFSKYNDIPSSSNLLKKIIYRGDENFPELGELLDFYTNAFSHAQARTEGKIIPTVGVCKEYDDSLNDIRENEKELNEYLTKQKKILKNHDIKYVHVQKIRYAMEIPEKACGNLDDDYELMSSRKGFKRYYTSELRELLETLNESEKKKESALKDTTSSLFRKFDSHHDIFQRVLNCLSTLDVILSLVGYSESYSDMCRPIVLATDDNQQAFINIRDGKHPCMLQKSTDTFIPNDIILADKSSNEIWQTKPLVLVTGPNMGGKSTLMRETAVLAILAHVGSYVPATSCKMSVCDRIFTRLGASDRIMAGESTFFVELSEASSILRHASRHSLVLIDELGRGTSTFDGTAIACSVVNDLANRIKCRTLFSTHYHTLVDDFEKHESVGLGHMSCMIEKDDETSTKETLVFLYKFVEGSCPKSHGFNAARLANIPESIIELAQSKASAFERWVTLKRILFTLKKITDKSQEQDILQFLSQLKLN
ncbi:unnamed protein product [Adineta steineri]|uniref:DNA mismatch repair protein n=1 Tax=Adineta steineri TaxID=433720 RepID=A0A814V2E3_9BILA|nr:unnamed protein product [Adineta steineri]CAF1292471.1 unnamed protein product [Adineta steineri]